MDKRVPTQQLTQPWPFLYSVLPEGGLVKNLPPAAPPRRRFTPLPPRRRSVGFMEDALF